MRGFVAVVLTAIVTMASGCWLTKSFDDLDPTASPSSTLPDGSSEIPDADADAGATSDPCAAAYYCDNFEDGLGIFVVSEEELSNGASIAPDTTEHAHGASSAKMTVAAGASPSALLTRSAALGADSYLRMFVFVPSGPAKTANSADYLAIASVGANNDTVSLRIDGNANARGLELGDSLNDIYETSMQAPFPFDRWACIEWHIGASGMQVWLDGSELTDITTTGALPTPTQQFFGITTPDGLTDKSGLSLWMDEIIVAKSRVGCTAFQQ